MRKSNEALSKALYELAIPIDQEMPLEVYETALAAALAEAGVKTGNRSFAAIFMLSERRLAVNAAARGQRAEALEFARSVLRSADVAAAEKVPAVAAKPRGLSAMGLTYAALLRSGVGQRGDRDEGRSWLTRALDAWRAVQSEPTFGAPHRCEMDEVEATLDGL